MWLQVLAVPHVRKLYRFTTVVALLSLVLAPRMAAFRWLARRNVGQLCMGVGVRRRLDGWLSRFHVMQWGGLLGFSICVVLGMRLLQVPAATLIGCLVAAVFFSLRGWRVSIPPLLFIGAQGVIGCMIARSIVPGVLPEIVAFWPVLAVSVVTVIAASVFLGVLMAKGKTLPGSTAIWGLLPGGATPLILMADANGADARLVAMMQYSRIVMVALVAAVVSKVWAGPLAPTPEFEWFPHIAWSSLVWIAAVVAVGSVGASRYRIPAGALLLPMALGATVNNTGLADLVIPPWLLAVSFAVVGWNVGLRFTPAVVRHCLKALPMVVVAVALLLGLCGGLAAVLTRVAGVDPLTAYLATSPGGVDSIAIIAASAPVDMPFIVALQTLRFFLVIMVGPWVAKWVSTRF